MASNETGECWVCGKETAQKCGACAEADFSLFFCSRECQKLIWPAHKRVCGPGRCNPFLWPELTKAEAEAAKSHLHWTPPGDPTHPTLSTLLEVTASALLDGLTEASATPSALTPEPGQVKQHTLLAVRAMETIRRKRPLQTAEDALQITSGISFIHLSFSPAGAILNPPPSWLTTANHLVLVRSAIGWREAQAHDAGDVTLEAQLDEYAKSCDGRIRAFAEQDVLSTHPVAAEGLLSLTANSSEA